jgi:hypothetical protein
MSSIVLLNICLECPHHLRHLCHLSSHRQHFGNARRGLPRLRRGLLVLQKKRVQDLLILLLRMLRRRLLVLRRLRLLLHLCSCYICRKFCSRGLRCCAPPSHHLVFSSRH